MAISTAPTIRRSANISTKAPAAISTLGSVSTPCWTSVSGLATDRPAFSNPISARKNPIPAAMASLRLFGIALISHSRAGVTETITNRMPDRNTQPSASRQSPPIAGTTVKAK